MTYLRPIALTVDESEPGAFNWLLIEHVGETASEEVAIAASDHPHATYTAALDEAVGALRALSQGRCGPRAARRAASWA